MKTKIQDRRINVRLTSNICDELNKMAILRGINLSTLLREILEYEVGRFRIGQSAE
jgi:predicted DNA binding CopG/RHH family protein